MNIVEKKHWGKSSGKENALLLQASAALRILPLELPLVLPLSLIQRCPPDLRLCTTDFQSKVKRAATSSMVIP